MFYFGFLEQINDINATGRESGGHSESEEFRPKRFKFTTILPKCGYLGSLDPISEYQHVI